MNDFFQILSVLYRRKAIILAVFLVVTSLGAYLAAELPNIYRSSTVILTPQKLPPSYVSPTVTLSAEQRIRTITEQILSRTSLERIINELNLYSELKRRTNMGALVEKLKRKIAVDVRLNDTFQLSFEAENPEKAMQVTARLGSLFIEETLQVREQQAKGTSSFINEEIDRLREELEEQERLVNLYKAKYRHELPEQLSANLRTLEQLRREIENNTVRISSLRERKATLEKQLVEGGIMSQEAGRVKSSDGQKTLPRSQQLENRRMELEALLTQYRQSHPDVIRLKRELQALETEVHDQLSKRGESSAAIVPSINSPVHQMLVKQIADVDVEINGLVASNKTLKDQIASYQARVDETPVRSSELSKISRTYEITLKKYQDFLAKSLESQVSENMEKKRIGGQFQVVDPANFPQTPVRPNRQRILLLALLLGLGGGVGLVLLMENMDTSFKRGDELAGYVSAPLLATIPAVPTQGSFLERRKAQGILVLACVGTVAIGIVSIYFYGEFLEPFF